MRELQTMSKTISKNLIGKQTKYFEVELILFVVIDEFICKQTCNF